MSSGLISTTGVRQLDGTVTVAWINALPFFSRGAVGVVNAGVVSFAQYSAASTDVTGPGLPSGGMISPRMFTRTSPLLCRVKKPRLSDHGALPAVTSCSIGSLGTLGASEVLSRYGTVLATALLAVIADPASAAAVSIAATTRLDLCITCLPLLVSGRDRTQAIARPGPRPR